MKLLKGRKLLIAGLVLLLIFLMLVTSQMNIQSPVKEKRSKVSLIVYGDDNERWENLRQGAGLVCDEKSADLTLVTTLLETDAAEQKEIIDREIEGGADALIIAACNSSEVKAFIDERRPRIPVVFVESLNTPLLSMGDNVVIAPDDYKMGYELGEAVTEGESDIVTVAIISENTVRDSVALREQGFRDAIDGKVGKVIEWKRSDRQQSAQTRMFIQKALVSDATDVIVTFDNSTTDALLDAMSNLNQTSKVYSIATSDKAVYNLNNKEIIALEYPNEFSMGYLAAMYALDGTYARRKYSGEQIEYRIVRKENMYDEDNQRLLFPFVN